MLTFLSMLQGSIKNRLSNYLHEYLVLRWIAFCFNLIQFLSCILNRILDFGCLLWIVFAITQRKLKALYTLPELIHLLKRQSFPQVCSWKQVPHLSLRVGSASLPASAQVPDCELRILDGPAVLGLLWECVAQTQQVRRLLQARFKLCIASDWLLNLPVLRSEHFGLWLPRQIYAIQGLVLPDASRF